MPQSNNMANRQSGRILIHERDVNDDAPIIGGDANELGNKYEAEYEDTISKNMEDNTRKVYCRRTVRIAKYWEEHCPVYYSTGVKIVLEAEYIVAALFVLLTLKILVLLYEFN